MLAEWDDHDVTDHRYPLEDLAGDPQRAAYKVTSVDLVAAHGAILFTQVLEPQRPS